MQGAKRTGKWLIPILVALMLILCTVVLFVLFAPATPKANVAFRGYNVASDGKRQAVFAITNTGRGTLRRWDFYSVALTEDEEAAEHHLGPDAMLAPEQLELVTIAVPTTDSPWKVTFYFTDYNIVEENAYANSGSDDLRGKVSGELIDGKVDLKVSADWIQPEN